MENKHTPSALNVIQHIPLYKDRDCENGGLEELARVLELKIPHELTQEEYAEECSHLIAAAPDLLEACKYVASYGTDEGLPSMETFAEMIYQCKQAIAKAEGK